MIITAIAVVAIIAINYWYYSGFHRKQIEFITTQLDRQVRETGREVDEFSLFFSSDLTRIGLTHSISNFFIDSSVRDDAMHRIKLYYTKYQDFIVRLAIISDDRHMFTLSVDETRDAPRGGFIYDDDEYWLTDLFRTHDQMEIFNHEAVVPDGSRYIYYHPIIDSEGNVVANFRITVDHRRFFSALFDRFSSAEYQWQWLIDEEGNIIQDNYTGHPEGITEYRNIDHITEAVRDGSTGNFTHRAEAGGSSFSIVSSYFPVSLLAGMDYGVVFSAPIEFFQIYVVRNSLVIVGITLLLIGVIIAVFTGAFKEQRKRMIDARESEEMLDRIIADMPVGVIIYNCEREVLKANKIASQLYSYADESDMIGKIYPESHTTDQTGYFSKYLGGTFTPDQFVVIMGDQGEIVLFRSSIPVTYAGEDVTMEILIDVTMLESARKEEAKANIAKSEFLARMSYEIRTPLNGIIGIADMLGRHQMSSELAEMVSILRRSSEVLLAIVSDILDFSQIESGRIILDEVPFNLRAELGYCFDLAQSNIEGRNIKIDVDVADDVPESVVGDPFRLRQVFTNLIQFSMQGIVGDGVIELMCRKVSTHEGELTIGVTIRDNGKGYPPARLKAVFGDLIQEQGLSGGKKDGSILSTILARHLIELMGGSLTATSPSGLSANADMPGVKIEFTFKVYSNERIEKSYDSESVKSIGDIRGLVVTSVNDRDDDVIKALHKAGVKPSVTGYTKATINQIKADYSRSDRRYNLLVITDGSDINGFEVGDALVAESLHTEYAIIMVSGTEQKGSYLKSLTMGVDAFIVKPFDSKEIADAVTDLFPHIEGREKETPGPSSGDLKMLLVEDNKLNRIVIGSIIESLGYRHDAVASGEEAIDMVRKSDYDLIFMDLMLPGIDGYEASRQILTMKGEVVIAALTADNLPESRKKCELSGIAEFITKPARPEHINRVVLKYFGSAAEKG